MTPALVLLLCAFVVCSIVLVRGAARPAQSRLHPECTRDLEHPGVVADGLTVACQHHCFRVIKELLLRHTAEKRGSVTELGERGLERVLIKKRLIFVVRGAGIASFHVPEQ